MRFSLNHSIAPLLPIQNFLCLADEVGVDAVELRDGMPPGWVLRLGVEVGCSRGSATACMDLWRIGWTPACVNGA
jgi:predicted xylose isomerase-like sugar epimerase